METTSFIFDYEYPLKGKIARDVSNVIKLIAKDTNTVAYTVEMAGFSDNKQVYCAHFTLPEEEIPEEDRLHAKAKEI
jgi:flagellar basal body rod protein FlgB